MSLEFMLFAVLFCFVVHVLLCLFNCCFNLLLHGLLVSLRLICYFLHALGVCFILLSLLTGLFVFYFYLLLFIVLVQNFAILLFVIEVPLYAGSAIGYH